MKDVVKCSACGCECDVTDICCVQCGELLPFPDEDCSACRIEFDTNGHLEDHK